MIFRFLSLAAGVLTGTTLFAQLTFVSYWDPAENQVRETYQYVLSESDTVRHGPYKAVMKKDG